MQNRHGRLVIGIPFLILLLGLGAGFSVPWVANQYGYALSSQSSLPLHISYDNRRFTQQALCWTQDQMTKTGNLPLVQVASVPTVFGVPQTVFASNAVIAKKTVVKLTFVPENNGCYVLYVLDSE